MCNTYVAKPKHGAARWQIRVSDDLAKLKSSLIRKSDLAVVVLSRNDDFKPETMLSSQHFNDRNSLFRGKTHQRVLTVRKKATDMLLYLVLGQKWVLIANLEHQFLLERQKLPKTANVTRKIKLKA